MSLHCCIFISDDVRHILQDIDDLKADYDRLGTCLGVRDSDIRAIRLQHQQDPWLCLKCVIVHWLNRNTATPEKPNRRILVDAVKNVAPRLGDELEEKYKEGLFTY